MSPAERIALHEQVMRKLASRSKQDGMKQKKANESSKAKTVHKSKTKCETTSTTNGQKSRRSLRDEVA
jgi:hypothetical protein